MESAFWFAQTELSNLEEAASIVTKAAPPVMDQQPPIV